MDKLKEKFRAPEFIGIKGWINSEPLSIEKIKGKIALLDFWTYTCINCRRSLVHMKRFYSKYKKYGFILIGIHTPEFSFEKEYKWVKKAIEKFKIEYPVALDSDNLTWFRYGNMYWPKHFLINNEGYIVYEHIGEGDYEEIEGMIIKNLKKIVPSLNEKVEEVKKEWFMHFGFHKITNEIYLGYRRMNSYKVSRKIVPYELIYFEETENLSLHKVTLKGYWIFNDEFIMYIKGDSKIKLKFYAKNVYVVVNSLNKFPIKIEIKLNENSLTSKNSGKDIKFEENKSFLVAEMPDMYHVISLEKPSENILELIPLNYGTSFYTFTFG